MKNALEYDIIGAKKALVLGMLNLNSELYKPFGEPLLAISRSLCKQIIEKSPLVL